MAQAVTIHPGTAKEILIGAAAVLVFAVGVMAGRYRREPAMPTGEFEPVEARAPVVEPREEPPHVVEEPPPPVEEEPEEPPPVVEEPPPSAEEPPPPVVEEPPPPAEEPPPAPRPRAPQPAAKLPRVPWPEGADELWRCEITWRGDNGSSAFRAIAVAPGARGGTAVATSPAFAGVYDDPVARPPDELVDAVRELIGELEDLGWTRIERGRRWYNQRFLWERADPPLSD